MTAVRYTRAIAVGSIFVLSGVSSGAVFYWLWREHTLYAVTASVLLLFGAAQMLPSRNLFAHAASLGFCSGVFIGGILGTF